MFQARRNKSTIGAAIGMAFVVFHLIVHRIRKSQRVPFMSIATSILQSITFVAVFMLMTDLMGMRSAGIRGDYVLYIMSGVFMYLTHTQSMGAVSGAEAPSSSMMQHEPMNTVVALAAAALSTLYLQVFAMLVIFVGYYLMFQPFEIYDWVGFAEMLILSWASGCALGLIVYGLKPWAPSLMNIITTVYQRANMIFSGKMFVANMLTGTMLAMFDWNPLFHIIDQARGYAFINYNPRNSNLEYPIIMTLIFLSIGLILQYYTSKRVSASWGARS